jgi:glc operon protein GlcG
VKNRPTLTVADCERVAASCRAEAERHQWSVTVAIVDDGGHLLWLTRLDGAAPMTADFAVEKARAAALSRRPTSFWQERIAAGALALLKMRGMPGQGGLPLVHGGECLGAVGVSGVQPQQDEQVAAAGLAALPANE